MKQEKQSKANLVNTQRKCSRQDTFLKSTVNFFLDISDKFLHNVLLFAGLHHVEVGAALAGAHYVLEQAGEDAAVLDTGRCDHEGAVQQNRHCLVKIDDVPYIGNK